MLELEQKKAERKQLLEESKIRRQQKKEEHNLQKQLSQAEYQRKPVRENSQSEIGKKKKSEEGEKKYDFLPVTWAFCRLIFYFGHQTNREMLYFLF